MAKQSDDDFQFKRPLFPSAAFKSNQSTDNERNLARRNRGTPDRPFWSLMTQPSSSPLTAADNVQEKQQRSPTGIDFEAVKEQIRRKFGNPNEYPPGRGHDRDKKSVNDPSQEPPLPGMRSFDYNHGSNVLESPNIVKIGQNNTKQNNPKSYNPKPLMQVTIPNPAALYQKYNKEDGKKDKDDRTSIPTENNRNERGAERAMESENERDRQGEGRRDMSPNQDRGGMDGDQMRRDLGQDQNRRGMGSSPNRRDMGSDQNRRDMDIDQDRMVMGSDQERRGMGHDQARRSMGSDQNRRGMAFDQDKRGMGPDQGRTGMGHVPDRRSMGLDQSRRDVDMRSNQERRRMALDQDRRDLGPNQDKRDGIFEPEDMDLEKGMDPTSRNMQINPRLMGPRFVPPMASALRMGPAISHDLSPNVPMGLRFRMAQGQFNRPPAMSREKTDRIVESVKRRIREMQNKFSKPAKRRKTDDDKPTNKRNESAKPPAEPPVVEYNAETLKIMDEVGQGSKKHQLKLIKKLGTNERFENKELVPWKCYLCDLDNETWQGYVNHCKSTKHKSRVIGLGTTLKKDERTKLFNCIKKLPFVRISFAVQKVTGKAKDATTEEGIMVRSAGLNECKPCGRFFLMKDRLQDHLNSDGHKKREHFLKQRYGNSWLDYHWYNQARKTERREVEPLGVAFVLPVSGFFCKLCSKFYNSEITAKDVHCRTLGHIDRLKEWDREQLTTKENVSLKLKPSEVEAAVTVKENIKVKKSRWHPAKITIDSSQVFLVDSDEDEPTQDKNEKSTARKQDKKSGDENGKEDLEEGELSERDVLRMERQQQEDNIKEEFQRREQRKQEKILQEKQEKQEKERKERERKEKIQKEKDLKVKQERERREKERLEKERLEQERREWNRQEQQRMERIRQDQERMERMRREAEQRERERLERESLERERQEWDRKEQERKIKEQGEKERLEREARERELLDKEIDLKNKLEAEIQEIKRKERELAEEEKREQEQREKELSEQLMKELKKKEDKEWKEKLEKEEEERLEREKRMKEARDHELREAQLLEMVQLEKRIREQEIRERELMDEKLKLRQMVVMGTLDPVVVENNLREMEMREKLLREQVDKDLKRLEDIKQGQEHPVLRSGPEVTGATTSDEYTERQRELEKKEQELREIDMREEERRRIELSEREMMERRRQEETMNMEMQTRREYEQNIPNREEEFEMKRQELNTRRNHEIEVWFRREAQMVAQGISEVEIMNHRQIFHAQLDERFKALVRELETAPGESRHPELDGEQLLEEFFQKGKGELMMLALDLKQEGYIDDQIQEVLQREEEVLNQRVVDEMRRRGFETIGVDYRRWLNSHDEERDTDMRNRGDVVEDLQPEERVAADYDDSDDGSDYTSDEERTYGNYEKQDLPIDERSRRNSSREQSDVRAQQDRRPAWQRQRTRRGKKGGKGRRNRGRRGARRGRQGNSGPQNVR